MVIDKDMVPGMTCTLTVVVVRSNMYTAPCDDSSYGAPGVNQREGAITKMELISNKISSCIHFRRAENILSATTHEDVIVKKKHSLPPNI